MHTNIISSLPCLALAGLCVASPRALAADIVVDATGSGGAYTTIEAAMLASSPGDRILVRPGTYPAFHFSRGVSVIGTGADPSQVVVRRVDYHVNVPTTNYESMLSNLTIAGTDPLDSISLSGNELGPGVLVLDGVIVEGGTFLRGGETGFLLAAFDSRFEPGPGEGFSGAAVFVGGPGNHVEIASSKITGWSASAEAFAPAGIGMMIFGGSTVRLTRCEISGGSGDEEDPAYHDGADAIAGGGFPGVIDLVLQGNSTIAGGTAAASGRGGDGVDVPGTIEVGAAAVTGGAGAPAGVAYANAQPTALPVSLHLAMTPELVNAAGETFFAPGESFRFELDPASPPAGIAIGFGLERPFLPGFWTLDLLGSYFFGTKSVQVLVPSLALPLPGFMLYAQGFVFDPVGGRILFTNARAARIDF